MPKYSATLRAYLISSEPSKPIENVLNSPLLNLFATNAVIRLESNPPDNRQPIGLSEIKRFSIAASNLSLICLKISVLLKCLLGYT